MGTSRRSASHLVSSLALLLVGAVPLACFKPAIVDGGLKCNVDAGAKACPEGFKCDSDGLCKRHPDGGMDKVTSEVMPEVMPEAMPETMCLQPVAGCTPTSTGMCDPVCQTGCGGCRQKCSVNSNGALTCNDPTMNGSKQVMEACSINSDGFASQTDNCAPGLVCVADECTSRCYKFCQTDNDCTNSSCTRTIAGGQKVCDVPFVDSCVPLMGSQNMGCAGLIMSCYLSSANPPHTLCDCPQGASGPNGPCTRTRECNRGLACVDRGNGAPICLQVCRLNPDAGSDCTGGQVCHPYLGIPPGPVSNANPNFGYCL